MSEQHQAVTRQPVPQVTIAGQTIPRMIVGSNQIGGYNHNVRYLNQVMTEYYTAERTTNFLRQCVEEGLFAWLGFNSGVGEIALKALWAEGSPLRTYFLSTLDADGNLPQLRDYNPLWLVHHGNHTDDLFAAGKHEIVHDFVKKVHDEYGIPAAVSCHNPDCVRYMEDHGWEVDFYHLCAYYLTRPKDEIRAKLGGAMLNESFLDTDRDNVLALVREVDKPFILFKILGAGWNCETDEAVEEAFRVVLTGIKKSDAIIVGMWPQYKDELAQNLALLRKYGSL